MRLPLGVLVSGRGSNMAAVLQACGAPGFPAEVRVVISNQPSAPALETAARHGVPTQVIPHRGFPTREAFDEALAGTLRAAGAELIVLAGFMRVVTPVLLNAFPGRVINIHPSLLPAFPGLDAQGQALAARVRITGCTVHFVTPGVDTGPIIIQAAVPVLPSDTHDVLAARILAQEHRLLPAAIQMIATGRVRCEGGAVHDALPGAASSAALVSPPLP